MVPGLSEADCRAAELRFRDLHADAARKRRAVFAPGVARTNPSGGGVLRARLGMLLVRAGQRLHGEPTTSATPALSAASGWGQ